MKWTVFCNAEDRFFNVFELFARKVILELIAQNHFFELLRTTNSCLVHTKQIMRMLTPQYAQKHSFSVRKKLLNAILRAKLQLHEQLFFLNWNEQFFFFLQCRKTDF